VGCGWWCGGVVENIIVACCSVSSMVLDVCFYMVRNSSGVFMVIVFLFWVCVSVVISVCV
jgi:hypothetical protein